MNRKTIRVGLSPSGIDTLIREVRDYQKWIHEKAKILLDRLKDEGYEVASMRFANVMYDGINDTTVSWEDRGELTRAIIATGHAALFIEFGAGVHYSSPVHPEAADLGMIRGEYGYKLGRRDMWRYKDKGGQRTAGGIPSAKHPGYIETQGNPANMPMYRTVKDLRDRLPTLVKEVFS